MTTTEPPILTAGSLEIYRKDSHFAPHGLPPSPPASVKEDLLFTEPEPITDIPSPPPLRRASTEAEASSSVAKPLPPPTSLSKSSASTHLSPDCLLLPPPVTTTHRDKDKDKDKDKERERPTRRNTTGSAPRQPPPSTTGVLEQDIQLHADHIRRERITKRAKLQAQAQAEAAAAVVVDHPDVAPVPATSSAVDPAAVASAPASKPEKEKEDLPLVGNLIGEGHVNYVLMYNMLTGIRIGVSRCQAKIKRPPTDADFKAKHKFTFDVVGNELTPSAKYDFKFKDYAPWIFRYLREDYFHLDPADYLLSLTSKYILSELGSPGKSGSFFYFSRDYRFIIKTIHHAEHAYLLKILPQYYEHVKANPHTLLSRIYGLHRVKLPRGRKIHFLIMNNIFPPHRDIHETYDLKGSTVGREYPEEKARENPRAVLKDLNWINRSKVLELGPEKRALLAEQLRRDSAFLESINVMDYSLLVGIHNMQRGNRDNVRRNTLKVFSPHIPHTPHRKKPLGHAHSYSHHTTQGSPEAIAIRRALYRQSDSNRLGDVQLPDAADPEPAAVTETLSTAGAPPPPHLLRWQEPESQTTQASERPPLTPSSALLPNNSNGYNSGSDDNVALTTSYAPHPQRASTHIGTSLSFSSSTSSSRPTTTTTTTPTNTSTTNNTTPSLVPTATGVTMSTSAQVRPLIKTRSRGEARTGAGVGAAATVGGTSVGGSGQAASFEDKKDLAEHFSDRQHFVFYQDEGGMRATNEANEDMNTIYYIGVIDILTPYGVRKKLESFWKGMSADRHKISPVPPSEYAHRFLSFMKAVMRGGEGGGRFKAE